MKKHIQVDLEPRLQLFRTSNHNLWPRAPKSTEKTEPAMCREELQSGRWQVASGWWQVEPGKWQTASGNRRYAVAHIIIALIYGSIFAANYFAPARPKKKKKKKEPETEITWNVPASLPLPLLQTSCRFHAQPGLACQRNYVHHRQRLPQLQLLSPCQGEAPSTVDPMQPSALLTNLNKLVSISFKWNLFSNL